jgi:ubiquinol-cytochrome c reductase iron-sulfur subunit
MGLGVFLIGAGAIQWAKKLMPDTEVVAQRHEMASPVSATDEAEANYERGTTESGFAQYTIIRRTLIGALALFPIPLVIMLRDLWTTPAGSPSPEAILSKTLWKKGERIIVDGTNMPVKAEDLTVGGRSQQGDGWDYQGILAFSKICTHVGCPIALYEQRTHHLLCPCHQSTFDLADSGNVIFGPAARRMPQLPIGVDEEGYLVAMSDFAEPVGPSFWERG